MFLTLNEWLKKSKIELIKNNEYLCEALEHNESIYNETLIENELLKEKINELEKENKELKNVNEVLKGTNKNIAINNSILECKLEELEEKFEIGENELLKEKVKEQDEMLNKISQDNAHMDNRIRMLENENSSHMEYIQYLESEKHYLEGTLEDYQNQEEIDEALNNDKDLDYYGTKDLDKSQYFNVLDKVTKDRNDYKNVINVLCDRYNISTNEVLDIFDDLKDNSKSKSNQLEMVKEV